MEAAGGCAALLINTVKYADEINPKINPRKLYCILFIYLFLGSVDFHPITQ